MEQFKDRESLKFTFPEVFGGGIALIELNPRFPEKGQKKYILKIGKDDKLAENVIPHWVSNKPKDLAKWVSDRLGELIG
jgi:hypothetical protein